MLGIEVMLNLMIDYDRVWCEVVLQVLVEIFGKNIKLFVCIINMLVKEKVVEDKWCKMFILQIVCYLLNYVEFEVVEVLWVVVIVVYLCLLYCYYWLKVKWLGLDKLQVWDCNVLLLIEILCIIVWFEVQVIVLDVYVGFLFKLVELVQLFFDKGWIDVGVKLGKVLGVFVYLIVMMVYFYVLLNYLGKLCDVMMLVYELGYGVYQCFVVVQGELLVLILLMLVEIVLVFGEMLIFWVLLVKIMEFVQCKVLIVGKVEDMINMVICQIVFYDFECKLYVVCVQGELMFDDINVLWMLVQGESFGDVFEFMLGYEIFWIYILYFIYLFFYVYVYVFGDGLVNVFYVVYEDGLFDFQQKYFVMLLVGGLQYYKELLVFFGLDVLDLVFWDKGLLMIEKLIDEFEVMEV